MFFLANFGFFEQRRACKGCRREEEEERKKESNREIGIFRRKLGENRLWEKEKKISKK